MEVSKVTVSGEMYDYPNHPSMVLKSDYGVFRFDSDGVFRSSIEPYVSKKLSDADNAMLVDSSYELKAYMTEDDLVVPTREIDSLGYGLLVFDEEYAVRVSRTSPGLCPNVLGLDTKSSTLVKVDSISLQAGHNENETHDFVKQSTLEQRIEECETVERASLAVP